MDGCTGRMVYAVGFLGFSASRWSAIFGSTPGGAGISVIPHTTRGLRFGNGFVSLVTTRVGGGGVA
jgi:hypothetical protein